MERTGETVAIVAAFDDPSAESDLAVYRSTYGLPPCGPGCFTKLNQLGEIAPLPPHNANGLWELEESLDLDMISATCPHCKIVLVEANDDADRDLGTAETTAAGLAAVVSNSFIDPEFAPADPAYDQAGKAILVAGSGDSGYGTGQPCAYSTVVCVGGTTLFNDPFGDRGWGEVVWPMSGSGCSAYVPKPAWQNDKGCSMRTAADISAVAEYSGYSFGGIAVYDTYPFYGYQIGWTDAGGTSASTPIVAGAFALTGKAKELSKDFAKRIWMAGEAAKDLHAVLVGHNWNQTPCSAEARYLCEAGTIFDGIYSGPAGWGTLKGVKALEEPTGMIPR